MTFQPKENVSLRRRKYAEGDVVSLEDLRETHRVVAEIVSEDPKFLPIFIRLDKELAARENELAILQRARQIAGRQVL